MNFKNPSGEPDAANEQDMNTFISLTREAPVGDMKEAMECIRRIEAMASAVEDTWADSLARKDNAMLRRAADNLSVLRAMVLEKLDQATLPYLRFYDKYVDDRTELNIEEVAVGVSVGMWATFSDMRPPRKSVQLERMGIKLDIPKPLLQQQEKFTYRFTRIPIVTYNLQPYQSIECSKYVVGDLIYFDILYSPPPSFSIRAKKWTIRDRSQPSMSIRKSDYPSSAQCRMYVKVPEGVLLTDDLRMAVWDEHEQDWVEDGISDYQCNEVTRTVQFYITTVGMLALVKRRTIDMPLKKWALYPVLDKKINTFMRYAADASAGYVQGSKLEGFRGLDAAGKTYERHARLNISTQFNDVVIDIIGSQVCLIKPDTALFNDLLFVPMSPGCLLKRLQRKGINLLPAESDLEQSEACKPKLPVIEEFVLQQISQAASALDFTSSPWNTSLSISQAGLCVRESSVYTCPNEENEYDCVLTERDEISVSYLNTPELGIAPGPDGIQCSLVIGNDYGRRALYSPVLRPDEAVHLELPRVLSNRITPEAMGRVHRTNQRFKKTVHTLLSLIKPFSQS